MPPFVFNLLFIPSFHILGSSYFYVSLSYGGISHCFNFDKFCDTDPLKSFTFKLKKKTESYLCDTRIVDCYAWCLRRVWSERHHRGCIWSFLVITSIFIAIVRFAIRIISVTSPTTPNNQIRIQACCYATYPRIFNWNFTSVFFSFFRGGGGEREWGSDQNNSNKWNLLQGKKRFHLLTTVKTKLLKYCIGREVRH